MNDNIKKKKTPEKLKIKVYNPYRSVCRKLGRRVYATKHRSSLFYCNFLFVS